MSTSTRSKNAITTALAAVLLVIAFTGSATATALITGRQVKDGSVTGADVRNGSVGRADLGLAHLSADLVPDDVTGPAGPVGEPGPAGAPGTLGNQGISNVLYQVTQYRPILVGQFTGAVADCPPGYRAVGGGARVSGSPGASRVYESAPNDAGNAWSAIVANVGPNTLYLSTVAVCVLAG